MNMESNDMISLISSFLINDMNYIMVLAQSKKLHLVSIDWNNTCFYYNITMESHFQFYKMFQSFLDWNRIGRKLSFNDKHYPFYEHFHDKLNWNTIKMKINQKYKETRQYSSQLHRLIIISFITKFSEHLKIDYEPE